MIAASDLLFYSWARSFFILFWDRDSSAPVLIASFMMQSLPGSFFLDSLIKTFASFESKTLELPSVLIVVVMCLTVVALVWTLIWSWLGSALPCWHQAPWSRWTWRGSQGQPCPGQCCQGCTAGSWGQLARWWPDSWPWTLWRSPTCSQKHIYC